MGSIPDGRTRPPLFHWSQRGNHAIDAAGHATDAGC